MAQSSNSSAVTTAFGIGGAGLGLLLVYAAFKNVPVLGPNGLLSSVFTTGKLPARPAAGGAGSPGAPGQGSSPPAPGTPGAPDGSGGGGGGGGGGSISFTTPTPPTPAPPSPASDTRVVNDNQIYWLPGVSL